MADALIEAGRDPATARADARLGVAVVRGLLLDLLATGDRREVDEAFERYLESDRMTAGSRATGQLPAGIRTSPRTRLDRPPISTDASSSAGADRRWPHSGRGALVAGRLLDRLVDRQLDHRLQHHGDHRPGPVHRSGRPWRRC